MSRGVISVQGEYTECTQRGNPIQPVRQVQGMDWGPEGPVPRTGWRQGLGPRHRESPGRLCSPGRGRDKDLRRPVKKLGTQKLGLVQWTGAKGLSKRKSRG